MLLELLLKSLLKKEFFRSKLFELEPLLPTDVVVVGAPCKNLTFFISNMKKHYKNSCTSTGTKQCTGQAIFPKAIIKDLFKQACDSQCPRAKCVF